MVSQLQDRKAHRCWLVAVLPQKGAEVWYHMKASAKSLHHFAARQASRPWLQSQWTTLAEMMQAKLKSCNQAQKDTTNSIVHLLQEGMFCLSPAAPRFLQVCITKPTCILGLTSVVQPLVVASGLHHQVPQVAFWGHQL